MKGFFKLFSLFYINSCIHYSDCIALNHFNFSSVHFILCQGTIATGISQPVDVMKTRLMNAEAGQYKVRTAFVSVNYANSFILTWKQNYFLCKCSEWTLVCFEINRIMDNMETTLILIGCWYNCIVKIVVFLYIILYIFIAYYSVS